MPRYFLHLRRAHLAIHDTRGVECSGPAEAVEAAVVMALDRMSTSHDFGRSVGWSVQIETETGEHVAAVPFALAWRMRLGRNLR
jgi:hypothetical protein